MKSAHGAHWHHYASRATGGRSGTSLDAYALLKTMIDNWPGIFRDAFPTAAEARKARTFMTTALDARNDVSHITSEPIPDKDILRYLDAIGRRTRTGSRRR